MQLIATNDSVILNSGQFFRFYPGSTEDTIDIGKVWIHLTGEGELINEALARKANNTADSAKVSAISDNCLLAWPLCPAQLGRVSSKLVDEGFHTHEELLALPAQLAALRARKPQQQHFRFAVVHGFGSGLGDSLVGMTAFRCVAEVMRQQLPSFSVDMLLPLAWRPAIADLIGDAPWIDRVLFQGPSLEDFAQYDGYFDVTEVLTLPQYNAMPTVDWYLWWFGLDPQAIDPSAKRNRGNLRTDAWHSVREVLRHTPGQKLLFNPKASTALRSMPPEQANQFAKRLLELDKSLHLVITEPLNFNHERLIDFSGKTASIQTYLALIDQVDGLITVDTFALHWADVCNKPTVSIFSSVESSAYPYYPFNCGIDIKGIGTLAAYKKSKVADEDWLSMQASYHAAWEGISADEVLDLLTKIQRQKQAISAVKKSGLSLVSAPRVASCVGWDAKTFAPQLKRQRTPAHIALTQERLGQLAQTLLKPGTTAVLAAPTTPALAVRVGQRVQALGAIHVFEPRPVLAQLLGGALVGAGVFNAQVHTTLPLGGITDADFPDLDPWSESVASEWGNAQRKVKASLQPIDDLQLPHCHALIIEPPMPGALVIEGALETLKRCRPFILMAPIGQADIDAVCQTALGSGYVFWTEPLLSGLEVPEMLLLGIPAESEIKINGFTKINIIN